MHGDYAFLEFGEIKNDGGVAIIEQNYLNFSKEPRKNEEGGAVLMF
jgi:hypothetical protein